MGVLVLLLIAGICGAVAEALVGFSAGGCLVSMAVGLVGAFVGSWLAFRLGLPGILVFEIEAQEIDVVWTIIGAMVFLVPLALFRSVTRGRKSGRL